MRACRMLAAGCAACVAVAAGSAWADVEIALLEVEGALAEQPGPLDWLQAGTKFRTLGEVVDALNEIAEDGRYEGVVVRLKDSVLPATQVQEIGAAIERVRASGRRVHVFAEFYGTSELMLGSYADEAIVQSGGPVSLSGLYMEEMYLADTLSWIGVKADLVQVGDYKGANEMFVRSEPSDAWEWNIDQLLDGLYGAMRSTLATNLGLTEAQLDEAMSRAWFDDAADAVEAGLIDAEVDLPRLGEHLAEAYGEPVSWFEVTPAAETSFDPSNPFAIFKILSSSPQHEPTRDTIAVVHVVGTIVDGDSTSGGLLGGQAVGSRTIRNALEKILEEDLIRGVVVRIDSPGGSAIASEVMWQGLQRVAEEKPVWVSVGSLAASGGYYTAVGGDKIYVNPSSIVGSIGVVGGKFSMGELYEKLRVNVVPRSRGPRADLFSSVEPWSADEREFVRGKMADVYELFTSRVEAGRPSIDLGATAEGRLFAGERALELGMADEIGSLDDAVRDLAAELGLERYDVMSYPGPRSLDEVLEEMFGGMVAAPGLRAPAAQAAAELLGPEAWRQVSNAGRALLQFRREPVQAVMPRVLIVR